MDDTDRPESGDVSLDDEVLLGGGGGGRSLRDLKSRVDISVCREYLWNNEFSRLESKGKNYITIIYLS